MSLTNEQKAYIDFFCQQYAKTLQPLNVHSFQDQEQFKNDYGHMASYIARRLTIDAAKRAGTNEEHLKALLDI